MSINCTTVTVNPPAPPASANIVATSATIAASGPNQIGMVITWKNTGGQTGTFTPKVSANDVIYDLGYGSVTLAPGEIYDMFPTLLTVPAGTLVVCPIPN